MKLLHSLVSATLIVGAGLTHATTIEDIEREMGWLERTTAQQQFEQDFRAGIRRFFSVCGIQCWLPGIGLNARFCHSDLPYKVIEGTGDAFWGDRHLRLMRLATQFALEYNLLVRKSEEATGRSTCSPKADWTAADKEFMGLLFHEGSRVAPVQRSQQGDPVLYLTIPGSDRSVTTLERKACDIARSRHLLPRGRIEVNKAVGEPSRPLRCA